MASQAQVVNSPARPEWDHRLSIFLAGTTSATGEPDWRRRLIYSLGSHAVTILNPSRNDWDRTWTEDFSDARWVDQVQWELDMLEAADIIVILFHGVTLAPISLAELGMSAKSGRAIACALDGYKKKGYVEAMCRKYECTFVRSEEELERAVIDRLRSLRLSDIADSNE
ncbi:hypothetical protein BKA56DRAFT_638360 [Ilyonectria sp. MPI-CAGE-AT-0026]|nr:hypothetical protein BKA56DRAFT_638360 [Ilyonectria sp. MPI-CAGE-AT-0026]